MYVCMYVMYVCMYVMHVCNVCMYVCMHVMLCCAVLCCAVLCSDVLCYVLDLFWFCLFDLPKACQIGGVLKNVSWEPVDLTPGWSVGRS